MDRSTCSPLANVSYHSTRVELSSWDRLCLQSPSLQFSHWIFKNNMSAHVLVHQILVYLCEGTSLQI
jgi:hypothetical protein